MITLDAFLTVLVRTRPCKYAATTRVCHQHTGQYTATERAGLRTAGGMLKYYVLPTMLDQR